MMVTQKSKAVSVETTPVIKKLVSKMNPGK
jgi:hypothetical protein